LLGTNDLAYLTSGINDDETSLLTLTPGAVL
jgi:hypothetical protein